MQKALRLPIVIGLLVVFGAGSAGITYVLAQGHGTQQASVVQSVDSGGAEPATPGPSAATPTVSATPHESDVDEIFDDGYNQGYGDGYKKALEEAQVDYESGYDAGYEDGYKDGSGNGD